MKTQSIKLILVIFIILNSFACKQRNRISNPSNSNDVKIYETNITLKKIKVSDIEKIEKKNSGIKYTKPINNYLSEDYFPDLDKYEFAQPIIYQRDTLNLNTEISYYFTKNDSIVRLIEYSWNTNGKNQKPFIDDLYSLNNSFITNTMKYNSKEEHHNFDYDWRKSKNWETTNTNIYSFVLGLNNEGYTTRVIVRQK